MNPMAVKKNTKIKNFLSQQLYKIGYDLRKFNVAHIEGFLGFDLFHDINYLMGGKPLNVVDVGACNGEWATELADYLDSGINRYMGFEPDPRVFDELVQRVGRNSKIGQAENRMIAIGKVEETRKFNLMSSSSMNSLLELGKFGWGSKVSEIEVSVVTLDSQLDGAEEWDILKIDTQGFDFEVLKGATDLIQQSVFSFITLEVNFIEIYEEIPDFPELVQLMNKNGYDIFGFYYPHTRGLTLAWCDIAFISKKWATTNSGILKRTQGM